MAPSDGEQFRAALDELLASESFARSPALARLLTYLVEQVMAGEPASVKESVIGHELYGLQAGYDPKLDSRVRVSANRLRSRLDDHYRANPESTVRIVLPKGTYVPLLEVHEASPLGVAQHSEQRNLESPQPWLKERSKPRQHRALFSGLLIITLLSSILLLVFLTRRQSEKTVATNWSVRPFARLGGSQQFGAFSPDGTRLAFVSSDAHHEGKTIYIQGIEAEEAERIAPGVRPAWSPDGRQLAFLRPEDNGKKQVILYNLATKSESVLTELDGTGPWLCGIPRLSWSRDGGSLFSSASLGGSARCGIVRISLDSHQVRAFIPPAMLLGDLEAAVSPDGKSVAFQRALGMGVSDIFVADMSGGAPRMLTHDGADLVGFDWTPDSKALIVASSREGGARRLWRLAIAGGPMTLLTDGSTVPTFPSVSPTGKTINFTQFHIVSPIWKGEAGGATEILDNQSENRAPTVSPDGKALLYASDRSGRWQLWLSKMDGSDARPLVRSVYDTGWGRWSPDGRKVIMECHIQNHVRICIANADGTGFRQLTSGNSGQVQPSWSHNGRYVYFADDAGGKQNIVRLTVDDGTMTHVTQLGAGRAIESWDGQWLFVSRNNGQGGIFKLPTAGTDQDWKTAEAQPLLLKFRSNVGTVWDVVKDGIVYLATDDSVSPRIDVFQLNTRKSRPLFRLKELSGETDLSIGVMPDGDRILFTAASTHSELNLMAAH